jgi:hypothetical protein
MAKVSPSSRGRGQSEDIPPGNLPETSPTYPHSDYSFTLQTVMELQKSTGQLISKVDRLCDDVQGFGTRLGTVEKAVDRVKTGIYVASAILTIVGFVFWWAIGDRVTTAVKSAISSSPPTSVLPPTVPPPVNSN